MTQKYSEPLVIYPRGRGKASYEVWNYQRGHGALGIYIVRLAGCEIGRQCSLPGLMDCRRMELDGPALAPPVAPVRPDDQTWYGKAYQPAPCNRARPTDRATTVALIESRGGITPVAHKLGIEPQTVHAWIRRSFPAHREAQVRALPEVLQRAG